MLENINLAFQGVWSHKLRSFLTMLGIIIGIAAIITIVSTIQGTNEQIKQNLIGAGNNVVRVTIGATDSQNYFDLTYSALPEGIDPVTREMRDEMEKLGSVSLVSMYYSRDWCDNVYVGNTAFSGSLYGVDDHYLTAVDYAVNYGRSFTAADYENRRNVALIDAKSAKSLFQGENPIGGTIEINGMPFTVVGVVSSRSSSGPVINNFKDYQMYAGSTAGTIFIPDVCWSVPYRYDEPQYAAVRATSTNDMTAAISASVDFTAPNNASNPRPPNAAIFRLGWIRALKRISCRTPFPKPGIRCSVARNALAERLGLAPATKRSK